MGMSIQTPVARDGYVYSAAGRVGGGAVRPNSVHGNVTAEEVYFDPKLPTAIGGAVLVGDYLHGSSQSAMCVEYKTGLIKWNERSIAPASLCYAEGLLYQHGEAGDVALIQATPDAYRERGHFTRANQPTHNNAMEKAWPYPVVANGRLYIRDLGTLWCYDIKTAEDAKSPAESGTVPLRKN